MNLQSYISGLRAEANDLRLQKSRLVKNGSRSWSRWGTEPAVETTNWWRAELDRRSTELDGIARALEEGRSI